MYNSLWLAEIAQRAKVRVLFSAPNKLERLCKITTRNANENRGCKTNHKTSLLIALSVWCIACRYLVVVATSDSLNEQLREHHYNVRNVAGGFLEIHCKKCGCLPLFDRCRIMSRNRNRLTREIIEAEEIEKMGDKCVNMPSIALTEKEFDFLGVRYDA
uniref:Tick transposon n=1 Tax=Rhipicephalus appendiculatus TaxID=34631 RepID=A0A131YWM8_RHIAP